MSLSYIYDQSRIFCRLYDGLPFKDLTCKNSVGQIVFLEIFREILKLSTAQLQLPGQARLLQNSLQAPRHAHYGFFNLNGSRLLFTQFRLLNAFALHNNFIFDIRWVANPPLNAVVDQLSISIKSKLF